jgi:hypothetical protein
MEPTRARRRVAVLLAIVLGLALVAVVGAVVVVQRAESVMSDRVQCQLPAGAEVSGVDLGLTQAIAGAEGTDPVAVSVRADAATVEQLVEGTDVQVADGVLSVSLEGQQLPASVVLDPSVVDGNVVLEPTSIRIGPRTFSPDFLAGGGSLPGGVEALTLTGLDLPTGVDLVSADVAGDHLDLGLEVVPAQADPAAC